MNNMLQDENVWNPADSEARLREWLEGKFHQCSGCSTRERKGEDEVSVLPVQPRCTSVDNASVEDVLNACCIVYGISITDIQGSPQSRIATSARRHAIWFLNKEYQYTASEAGNEVFRDSKSARQAINLVEGICRGKNRLAPAGEFFAINDRIVGLLGGRGGKARG